MSAAAPDPAAIAAALKEAAYFVKAEQIFFSAMYAVCVWDWLVSLQREWRLIWQTKWSVIKVLYLLCRYWVIGTMPLVLWIYIEDHSLAACQKLFHVPPAVAMWNQLWAEGVLLVRTYAFLGNRIEVLVSLGTCLAGIAAYQIYAGAKQMALLPFLDPGAGPCYPTVTYPGSPHIMAFWLAPMIFDTIVTALTLYRMFQLRRQSGGHGSPLLKTFVTEGLWYFLLISAANLANAIFYWQPKAVMSALLVPLSVMFPDILVCRMILGLRERGIRHTSGNQATSHASSHRKATNANKLTAIAISKGPSATKDQHGAITDMGFNHELTTFQRGGNDSESMVGRDIKSVPYEEGVPDPDRARSGIRVDIESHRYYEDSDGNDDHKAQPF